MKSVLHEHDGYVENVTVELDASETLVLTRALVRFSNDASENSTDRLVATRMVRDLQTIADTPQTEEQYCIEHRCTHYYPQFGGCTKTGDCPHIKDTPQTDCAWREP